MIVFADGARAFALTPAQRLERQLPRHGLKSVDSGGRLVIRGDHVYGDAVIRALKSAPAGTVLVDGNDRPLAAHVVEGEEDLYLAALGGKPENAALPENAVAKSAVQLTGRYDKVLRKRADPIALSGQDAARVEKVLFDASYKGVTDFVTKYVWPAPALMATRWCALRGITPNQVTLASFVMVVLAFWLFWTGQFAAGLVCAWIMTFLDTLDGKLARVTLTASKWGDVFDHGIDLIHPPFWWWAWAVGCGAVGQPLDDQGWTLGIIVAGYVLQRGQEGLFIARFGIEMHIWRRFDSIFRLYTARRNPNLVILTVFTLFGEPRLGLIVVAVWVALSFLVHMVQIVQAFLAPRPLTSWLADA